MVYIDLRLLLYGMRKGLSIHLFDKLVWLNNKKYNLFILSFK
jgi:hypothetical protein